MFYWLLGCFVVLTIIGACIGLMLVSPWLGGLCALAFFGWALYHSDRSYEEARVRSVKVEK